MSAVYIDSRFSLLLVAMFYEVSTNTEFADTETLLLGEAQG